MRQTKVNEFLRWLEQHGPANWGDIQNAGFRSTFNGASRKRLISAGVIIVERGVTESPQSGAHRNYNLYSIGPGEYVPKKAGRRPGYRLSDDAREQMMVRSAMTILRKRGYMIVPPTSNAHG